MFELLSHELLIRGNIGVETLLFLDEFAQLNGVPAIFQLQIDDFGFTYGKIWRWSTGQ